MQNNRVSFKRRALGAVFNRKNASRLVVAGLLTDLFGYSGEYGGKLLSTNSITQPAASLYRGFGAVMNFSWESAKELATGLKAIADKHNAQNPPQYR